MFNPSYEKLRARSYEKLEQRYLDEVKHKVPEFYRQIILNNHHDKVPRLRAALMKLHQESDDSIDSRIKDELPHIDNLSACAAISSIFTVSQ